MTAPAKPRMNLTGSKLHPDMTKDMAEATQEFPPSSSGDESRIIAVRAQYMAAVEPIGSIPLPLSPKGVVETVKGTVKGQQPLIFTDRLGERLAFERSGVRLYEAFLGKVMNADRQGAMVDLD